MQIEITAALNFVANHLYNKLPRRRVDSFIEEIERGIATKFKGHWYPDNPSKGAAYRCINISGEKVDPVIIYAAINSGLDIEEVNSYLPKDLTLWIDPGEVSYSIGERGVARVLYSERRSVDDSAYSSHAASPVEDPGSSLSSSFGSLSLSPASSSGGSWGNPSPIPWTNCGSLWGALPTSLPNSLPAPMPAPLPVPLAAPMPIKGWPVGQSAAQVPFGLQGRNHNKTMTAAMFAQTKFGSTKLKSNSKRSSRLSPTDSFTRAIQPPQSLFMPSHNGLGGNAFDRLNQLSSTGPFMDQTVGNRSMSSSKPGGFNGCISPDAFAPLSPDQDWIDLTDMNVFASNNQLVAT